MSYQVIARKWRPQVFEEVTGQEAITRTLQNSIEMKRLHHAFIFSGPRGCGKTTTARILAKALNCFEGLTSKPCGKCSSCLEITAGNSIDVLEIDAASNTGVDNVRDVIINTVAINPARDRYKIFIIDEVHMLSISAFNALLKTLEEPPSHIAFILATTELHKLPQTILSRCQHFEFKTIAAESIASRLRIIADAEKVQIGDEALMMIAFAGQGSMRDAQSAFDQVISFAGVNITEEDVRNALGIISQQTLANFTLAIADHNQQKLIHLTAELASVGYDLRQFCRDLMVHFRNLLMLKTVGYEREILPIISSELPSYQEQASRFSSEDLVRFFHVLTNLEQEIKLSTQPKFHLEIGLIKLAQLTKLQSLEEILFWLKALEEKITGEPGKIISTIKQTNLPATSATSPTTASKATLPKQELRQESPLPKQELKQELKQEQVVVKEPISRISKPTEPVSNLPAKPFKTEPIKPTLSPLVLDTDIVNEKVTEMAEEVAVKPATITDANAVELLKRELEAQRKWMLLTALDQGKIEIQNNILKVRFSEKAKIYQQTVNNKENRQALMDASKSVLGVVLKLDFKIETSDPEENLEDIKKQQILKQAEQNPVVQMFIKTFKGELLDVEVEDEKKKG